MKGQNKNDGNVHFEVHKTPEEDARQEFKACNTQEGESQPDSLPKKSKTHYQAIYNRFLDWKKAQKLESSSEETLVAYFQELEKKYAPSSLWTYFSMLKLTLMTYEKVDIEKFTKVTRFLPKNKGFESKKAKIFTIEEVRRFLSEAPDDSYLAIKVTLIFGIYGFLRTCEMTNMRIQNIKQQGDLLVVEVPGKDANQESRRFMIDENCARVVKKYWALRPPHAMTDRFFLNYHNGKCTVQVIGKHKFTRMAKEIARFLKLDEKIYTGLALRRVTTKTGPSTVKLI